MRKILLPLGLVAALATAGCGSDSKSDSNRAESYSGLIAKADAVCTKTNTDGAAAGTDVTKLNQVLDDAAKNLRALTPPDKLKDAYTAFLDKVDASVAANKKAFAEQGKAGEAGAAATASAASTEVDAAASAVGLQVCSKPS